MADQNKCANPNCNCTAKDGEKYCSPACHDSRDTTQIACQCAHSGCTGTAMKG